MNRDKYNNPFKATFYGILDLFDKKEAIGVLSDQDRIDGKTCLVTGANSGLGFAIACQLAQRGGRVIMACRSGIPEAGEKAKMISGSSHIEMISVDLSDKASIHNLVDHLKNIGVTIDIAIFNAAMVPKRSRKTKDGLDEMFMVNYLAKFILVNGLLDEHVIVKNESVLPRIIFVSSEAHRTEREFLFDQLGIYEEYKMGDVIGLYGYYKLLLNTMATESPAIFKPLLKLVFRIFFASPTKAAEPVVFLACSDEIEKKEHVYLHLMQQKVMHARALDRTNGLKLWERSEQIIKRL